MPTLGKALVTLALLMLLLGSVETERIATRLQALSAAFLLPILALVIGQTLVAAARWRLVMVALDVGIGFVRTWTILLIGLFFNQSLPSTIGGDLMRIWRLHRAGCNLGKSVSVVLLDRLSALVGVVLMVLAALPAMHQAAVPSGRGTIVLSMGAIVAALAVALLVFFAVPGLPAALARWRPLRSVATLVADARSLTARPGHALAVTGLAIAVHAMSAVTVYLLARGFHIEVTLLDCLMYVPAVILVSTVPVSIAGWGVREGAMVGAFALSGVSSSDALLLSVAFGLAIVLSGLPGGFIWFLTGRRRPEAVPMLAP
jgi:uncharacterized membrane protein YbhN (UPF0104 family)